MVRLSRTENADDLSRNVGTPGQTGRQRIGQSSRCTKPCGCDGNSFCSDVGSALKAVTEALSGTGNAQSRNKVRDALQDLKKDFCDNSAAGSQVDQMLNDVASIKANNPASIQTLKDVKDDLQKMKDQMCGGGGPAGDDKNCRESPLKALMDANRDQRQLFASQLQDGWNKLLEVQDQMNSNREAWNAFVASCAIADIISEVVNAALDALTPDELADALDLIESIANGDLIGLSGIEDLQNAQDIFEKIFPGGSSASWAEAMRSKLSNCPNLNQNLTDGARRFVDAYAQMPKLMGNVQQLISRIKQLDREYWEMWNKYYSDCLETAKCKGLPASTCEPPPPAP